MMGMASDFTVPVSALVYDYKMAPNPGSPGLLCDGIGEPFLRLFLERGGAGRGRNGTHLEEVEAESSLGLRSLAADWS